MLKKSIVGIVVVALITLLMAFVIYAKEPIGDDVLGNFEGVLTYYLDEVPDHLGEPIGSLTQVGHLLRFVYRNWSGRIPGYALEYIAPLLPEAVTAVATAVIYTLVCLLALRIIFGNLQGVLEHPVYFVLLYLMLFWTRPDVYYTHMWIMTSIYVCAVMLNLLYWNMAQSEKISSRRQIVCMQLVGILAGMAHEVLSLCAIVVIFSQWLIDVWSKKKLIKSALLHSGLMFGYALGFFAPGNFNRVGQSHDVMTSNLISRLSYSIKIHIHSILGGDRWMTKLIMGLLAMVVFSFVYLLISGKKIRELCREIAPMLLGGTASILVWGLMPRVPAYGLDLWIILITLIFVKIIHSVIGSIKVSSKLNSIAAILLLCFVVKANHEEIRTVAAVSQERTQRIQTSVEQNLTEVVVPRYPEWLSPYRHPISHLNDQKEYDSEYYQEYYQIHIIVETEGNASP